MIDPIVAVAVSFGIFMFIAYRLGYRQSMKSLDDKIAAIRQALEDAAKAKEAALQAMTEERRRFSDIEREVDLTISRAEEQTLSQRHQTLQDLDALVKKRHHEAEQMIDRFHKEAIKSLQEETTAATLATFETLVAREFSATQHETLNEQSIVKIAAQLKPKGRRSTVSKQPKPKRRATAQ